MKKLLILLVLSASTLFLTGCFGGDDVVVNIPAGEIPVSTTFEGVIMSIPSTISGIDATHVLETEAGESIYLRSVLFELERLMGSRVRVSGLLDDTTSTKLLLVESRDILESNAVVDPVISLRFAGQGFEIELDTEKYTPTETATFVNFVSSSLTFSIETIKKGFELDLQTYLGRNYPNQVPQDVITFKGDRFSKIVLGTGNYVYLRNTNEILYEVVFNTNQLAQAEANIEIDNILQALTFTPETVNTQQEIIDLGDDEDTIDSGDVVSNVTSNVDQDANKISSKDLSDLSRDVVIVIEDFNMVKSDKVGSDVEMVSYTLTDNDYIYISYKDSENQYRKLFEIKSGVFNEVAYFEAGVETDWELVSGKNLAFDRPQKIVFVEGSKFRQVDVKVGYRYFESRPMFFGFHYPKNWYFAGDSKIYRFSNKPLSEGETLVLVELVNDKFEDIGFDERISDKIVKRNDAGNIVYYVMKEDKSVIKISGSNQYKEQIDTMSQTFVEVDRS